MAGLFGWMAFQSALCILQSAFKKSPAISTVPFCSALFRQKNLSPCCSRNQRGEAAHENSHEKFHETDENFHQLMKILRNFTSFHKS
jgi:hypothetical protein